jgi:SAM-dependent methyltransferase
MTNDHHEKNRAAWNQMVEVHYHHPDYKLHEFLDGWNSLKTIERDMLGDVSGMSLLHLMCQFGMDTLSWARLGATVTGADISDKSIEFAEKLRVAADIPDATFIRSDVNDLIGRINSKVDIIFQSYGTWVWLSDIKQWAKVIAHYLKPGGRFFIVDQHPVWGLFEPDFGDDFSYFDDKPQIWTDDRDYCDRDFIIKGDKVEFQHTLASIVNALIQAGLTIERLDEYNHSHYAKHEDWYQVGDYWYPPSGPTKFPMMFSLLARKPE